MTKRKTRAFCQIEDIAKNYLELHNCCEEPYHGIDFVIESCSIDLIPLRNVTNDKLLGFYGNNGKEKFIAYNANLIPQRILFTKAHELGHFALGHELKSDIVTESVNSKREHKDQQETEANVFAASFLMPKKRLYNFLKKVKYDVNTPIDTLTKHQQDILILAVCNRFRTSKQATYFRLKNLSNN